MGILGIILWCLLIVIIITAIWFVFTNINNKVFGETAPAPTPTTTPAPAPVVPTPVPTPTPTAPNPNLQYLPQKAYVQSYAPEIGLPQNTIPLQAVPTVVPVQQQQQGVGGFDIGSIMGILSMLAGGGALLKSKMVGDKTNKVEAISKDTMGATVQTKEQVEQAVRTMFKLSDPVKVAAIDDAPAIKLETLAKDKAEFAEKAAKA